MYKRAGISFFIALFLIPLLATAQTYSLNDASANSSANSTSSTASAQQSSSSSIKAYRNFIFSYAASSSAPLAVDFYLGWYGDAGCDGSSYSIDYGDGAAHTFMEDFFCGQPSGQITLPPHTYTQGGSFTVSLKRDGQVVETLPVVVGGPQQSFLTASTRSGTAPLTVTFSDAVATSDVPTTGVYYVISGDLPASSNTIVSGFGASGDTFSHAFQTPGTYDVTLLGGATSTEVHSLHSVTIIVRPQSETQNEGTTAAPSCAAITHTLQRGDTDETTDGQVTELQQFLTNYYKLDGSLVVGTFGPLTEHYVTQFQTDSGIPAVGYTGPLTRQAIKEACGSTASASPSPSPSPSGNASCVALTKNLYLDVTDDMTGGEVTKLQQFLIGSGYMSGQATGFFGPLTLKAVQAYQAAQGIVSSGDPDTTGWGYVGPKTRAIIGKNCTPTTSTSAFSATPTSGAAPLAVTFSGSVKGKGYKLDFGDGSTPVEKSLGVSCSTVNPNCGNDATLTVNDTHTYAADGTYTAILTTPSPSVTCTDINYDPNNPISFLGLGTGNCTSNTQNVEAGRVTITVGSGSSSAAGKPDYVITAVTVQPAAKVQSGVGVLQSMVATVKNVGGDSGNASIAVLASSPGLPNFQTSILPIAAGQSQDVTLTNTIPSWNFLPGTYTYTVKADYTSTVDEASEDNNTFTTQVLVAGTSNQTGSFSLTASPAPAPSPSPASQSKNFSSPQNNSNVTVTSSCQGSAGAISASWNFDSSMYPFIQASLTDPSGVQLSNKAQYSNPGSTVVAGLGGGTYQYSITPVTLFPGQSVSGSIQVPNCP